MRNYSGRDFCYLPRGRRLRQKTQTEALIISFIFVRVRNSRSVTEMELSDWLQRGPYHTVHNKPYLTQNITDYNETFTCDRAKRSLPLATLKNGFCKPEV